MRFLEEERNQVVNMLRKRYPAGIRVELVHMDDPFAKIPIGTRGTVSHVDDIGTTHVKWDNGSYLGVLYKEDRIRIVEEGK